MVSYIKEKITFLLNRFKKLKPGDLYIVNVNEEFGWIDDNTISFTPSILAYFDGNGFRRYDFSMPINFELILRYMDTQKHRNDITYKKYNYSHSYIQKENIVSAYQVKDIDINHPELFI